MFTDLFESAARVRALRDGPAGPLLEAFAHALVRERYAPITARRHLRAAEHFVHWADRAGIPVSGAGEPALQRFARHLQRAGRCPHFGHTFRVEILHGARLFLTHLQEAGLIAPIDGEQSRRHAVRDPRVLSVDAAAPRHV